MKESIPSEVLSNIAIHLSQQDIYTCLCVCRLWNAALTPTLYNSVKIRSRKQLERFMEALRSTEASNPLGHLVRKISDSIAIAREELILLQHLCPFVVEFDNHVSHWYPDLAENLQGWKHLAKIPYVIIKYGPPNFSLDFLGKQIQRLELHIKEYPEWIDLMTELPYVEELMIDGTGSGPKISLFDLETVHGALPRLKSLTLWNISICGEIPEDIASCNTLHSLHLNLYEGRRWGLYFARKYINLESLNISWLEYTANMLSEVKTLTKSCRVLKWFWMNVTEGDEHGLYRQHLQILREIGAPITNLVLYNCDFPAYAAIISGFHATLSKIQLYTGDEMTVEEIFGPLKVCQSLEYLNIYGFSGDLGVDYCLSCCRNLKELQIMADTIVMAKNCTIDYQHGLESLNMCGKYDIADEVYPYLLQHCPLLSELFCSYAPTCNRSCEIYIPSPRLRTLYISYLKYSLYKVIAVQSPERNRIPHASIDEQSSHDQERWYIDGPYKDGITSKQLDALEVDQVAGQLYKPDSAHRPEELEQSNEEHKLSSKILWRQVGFLAFLADWAVRSFGTLICSDKNGNVSKESFTVYKKTLYARFPSALFVVHAKVHTLSNLFNLHRRS